MTVLMTLLSKDKTFTWEKSNYNMLMSYENIVGIKMFFRN